MKPALEGDQWRLEELPNGNWEFSLRTTLVAGHNIMPDLIRDQGQETTCVFEAALGTAETDVARDLAENQQRTNHIRFNKTDYVERYEEHIGMSLSDDEDLHAHIRHYREETALTVFENLGVFATSDDWEGEKEVRLRRSRKLRFLLFPQVAKYILKGNCLMGGMPVGPNLVGLGPDEIYQFYQQEGQPRNEEPEVLYGHMVVFMGFGLEGSLTGRPYLKFLNSAGPNFGDGGYGRVYFDQIYRDRMYLLNVEQMPLPPHQQQDVPSANLPPVAVLDDALDDNVQSLADVVSAAAIDAAMLDVLDDDINSMDNVASAAVIDDDMDDVLDDEEFDEDAAAYMAAILDEDSDEPLD